MSTMRTISIYSSRGEKASKIETDVTTWGALRPLIKAKGYEVDKLHASENVRKSTLEHADAVLPEGNFTIFMRPKQTKSGAKKRADGLKIAELKNLAKEDIASFPNMGKAHYGAYSKMKVDELAELVNTFKGSAAKEKAATPKETKSATKKSATASKTSTAKSSKADTKSTTKKADPKPKASSKRNAPSTEEVVETESEMASRMAREAKDFERGLL